MAPLAPDEAWNRIAARLRALPEETGERRTAAGRVLARGLAATVDVPAADVSAMDGYVVAGEVRRGERRTVAGTVAAGDPPGFALAPPAVARIMTGAPVPPGADRVIPVEATDAGRGEVVFHDGAKAGENIRRRGEILHAGEALLPAGARLTPGFALLATHGYAALPLHRAPSVSVLTTGDEVVPPEVVPAPGQLRDSNTDFLLAAGTGLGLRFESLGIAADRVEALRPLIERGLRSDVLLLCGGVSMGEFDLVEGVLAELGCEVVFDGVAIQPGKPLVFATARDGRLVFGLPGNPASVMVTFWLFVRPALRCLMGIEDSWWGAASAGTLDAPLPGAGNRDRFLPAAIAMRDGELRVTPFPPKGSHDLAAYARGTALVRVRPGAPPAPPGERCEALILTL